MPGSFDIYVKKYLQRGHTGMTNWFNDDIIDPTCGDYSKELNDRNPGNPWDHRAGEFNGLRIGADFVPVRNTKLLLHYTYGKLGIFWARSRARRTTTASSARSGKSISKSAAYWIGRKEGIR